jgi:hypothetical protein
VIKLNSRTIVTLESSDCHEEKVKLNCSPSSLHDHMILQKNTKMDMRHVFLAPTQNEVFFLRWENHHGNGTFKGTDPADLFVKESDHWLCGKPFWLPSDSAQQGVKLDS